MIALVLLACGGATEAPSGGAHDLADYLGLDEDASWVYRDDGVQDEPVEELLLRARHTGGGRVELRRGTRWADALAAGAISWDTSDGLSLLAFQLGEVDWSGRVRLAGDRPEHGDRAQTDGTTCEVRDDLVVETFYALFDDTLSIACSGGSAPEGTFAFAREAGLVQVEAGGVELDLVAPW